MKPLYLPTDELVVHQINDVERAIKQAFPEVRWSFFEPDLVKVLA